MSFLHHFSLAATLLLPCSHSSTHNDDVSIYLSIFFVRPVWLPPRLSTAREGEKEGTRYLLLGPLSSAPAAMQLLSRLSCPLRRSIDHSLTLTNTLTDSGSINPNEPPNLIRRWHRRHLFDSDSCCLSPSLHRIFHSLTHSLTFPARCSHNALFRSLPPRVLNRYRSASDTV